MHHILITPNEREYFCVVLALLGNIFFFQFTQQAC